MPLSLNNQLMLLYDLLDEHTHYRTADVDEYKQIKRVVRSLMANGQLTDEELLQLLPEIYYYGIQGEQSYNLQELIDDNEHNLLHWKHAIANAELDEHGDSFI